MFVCGLLNKPEKPLLKYKTDRLKKLVKERCHEEIYFFRNGILFSHVEDPPTGGPLKDKYMLASKD
jgi:hypothetical protein